MVAYDADTIERPTIRSILNTQLHWIQNSVFAGEMTRTAAKDLRDHLQEHIESARITMWVYDRQPERWLLGHQEDEESMFV